MFLSQVEIDRMNRKKTRDLTHVGAFHHWVEQSFPEEVEKNIRTRKLWRIDRLQERDYLLIVSDTKPDLVALEKYGMSGSAQTKDYDKFLNSLRTGERGHFRVTLNPVVSKYIYGAKRGRVMPHVTVDQQMDYLLERSNKNGFSLDAGDFAITERGYSLLKKQGNKDIRLSRVSYQGYLTITDVEKFRQTLTEGFGKKKAYGFGMLTFIPER